MPLPSRREREVWFEKIEPSAQGLLIRASPRGKGTSTSSVRTQTGQVQEYSRTRIPCKIWNKYAADLQVYWSRNKLRAPLRPGTVYLSIFAAMVIDSINRRVYRRFVMEWLKLYDHYSWYRERIKEGVQAPWGFPKYCWKELGKRTCLELASEFRRPNVGCKNFRQLVGRRCPILLGTLYRLSYAEVFHLLATVGATRQ